MQSQETQNVVSPSERLASAAKRRAGPGASGAVNMSDGLARRLKERRSAANQPQPVSPVEPVKDAAGPAPAKAAPQETQAQAAPQSAAAEPAAATGAAPAADPQLAERLAAIEARVESAASAAEFTEAYVSAGMTTQISQLIAKEFAFVDKMATQRMRHRRRMGVAALIIMGLVGLVVAESQYDIVVPATQSVTAMANDVGAMTTEMVNAVTARVRTWLV